MKSLVKFFDKLEDAVRGRLSKYPLTYAFFGGSGMIIFWRGIWHLADYYEQNTNWGRVVFSPTGSILLGMLILLVTGLFVSVFIGESILLSGLKHEKKITEKTEEEIKLEKSDLSKVLAKVEHIDCEVTGNCDVNDNNKK